MSTNLNILLPQKPDDVWPSRDEFPLGTINTTRFRLVFPKMPYLEVFCNVIPIPRVSFGIANQDSTYLNIKHPGEKLYFDNLSADFLVDNEMKNYVEIFNWMQRISTLGLNQDTVSDAKILVNTKTFNFYNVYPISIGGDFILNSTNTDIQFPSCNVVFAYDNFNIQYNP